MYIKPINNIKNAQFTQFDKGLSVLGEDAIVKRVKATYIRQIFLESDRLSLAYNNNGECVGMQFSRNEEFIQEIIVIPKKRTCKVIISKKDKKFIGIAKCHPYDKFVATKGIEIAKRRAIIKENEYLLKELYN